MLVSPFTDMNLDMTDETSNELNPAQIVLLDPRSRDISSQRQQAIRRGGHKHLCLQLGGNLERNLPSSFFYYYITRFLVNHMISLH